MSKSSVWKITNADDKPPISINQDKATCGICHRQISRYTCPTCNIPYCSLTCFRSDAHAQCAEPFYKREVEVGIKAQPNASAVERKRMMELLKRFEEEEAGDKLGEEGGEDGEGDEEDEDGLAKRLGGVDLENLSTEEIWTRLTPSERSAFLKAIQDPDSEAAKALLRSKDLETDLSRSTVSPWWDAPLMDEETDEDASKDDDLKSKGAGRKKFGEVPELMTLPSSMLNNRPSSSSKGDAKAPPLVYNICAVSIAYAYVTRHLAFSPLSLLPPDDADVARGLLRSLLLFLSRKDAQLVYASLDEVITHLWAKLITTEKVSKEVFALLLRDAAILLQPTKVTELHQRRRDQRDAVTDDSAVDLAMSPSLNTLLMLSDLTRLFTSDTSTKMNNNNKEDPQQEKPAETHASLKLRFYSAHVLRVGEDTGYEAFARLASALERRAEKVVDETSITDEEKCEIRTR